MPTAPLYRRDEVVYLKSSAEIGKLEAFKINGIKQIQNGRWLYRIDIAKKPPAQGLIGDSFDGRIAEPSLYYTAAELITVCEALDIITTRFRNKLLALEAQVASRCSEDDTPEVGFDEPRWGIGDFVYFAASARLGFMHHDCIKNITEVGIQPKTRRIRYVYQVVNVPNPEIYFREDELLTYCEAADFALEACRRDLEEAEAKRARLCS